MAFSSNTLAKLTANSNPDIMNVFAYQSADTAATVNTANYFLTAYANYGLKAGDLILAYLDTGGTPQSYIFTVNSASSAAVDVTDGLAVGTTDTD